MTVQTTRVTDRRSLHFESMAQILADVEALGAAASIRATGNWTPAQVVDHLADFMHASLDGMEPGPVWMRIFRLLKSSALKTTMRPGFKIPRRFGDLAPDPEVTWAEATGKLQTAIARIDGGERMAAVSPFLGPMTHEEWEQLHCRHAEMHLSFLHPEGG